MQDKRHHLPVTMVHNNRTQIINVRRWHTRLAIILQHIFRHIQRFYWKIYSRIDFGAEKIIPAEALDVQA